MGGDLHNMFKAFAAIVQSMALAAAFIIGLVLSAIKDPWGFFSEFGLPVILLFFGLFCLLVQGVQDVSGRTRSRRLK